jgi:hypothetical protein
MDSERRSAAGRGRGLAGLCLLAALVAGGCRLLADEFTWLDRAAPAAVAVPDAPQTGVAGRP